MSHFFNIVSASCSALVFMILTSPTSLSASAAASSSCVDDEYRIDVATTYGYSFKDIGPIWAETPVLISGDGTLVIKHEAIKNNKDSSIVIPFTMKMDGTKIPLDTQQFHAIAYGINLDGSALVGNFFIREKDAYFPCMWKKTATGSYQFNPLSVEDTGTAYSISDNGIIASTQGTSRDDTTSFIWKKSADGTYVPTKLKKVNDAYVSRLLNINSDGTIAVGITAPKGFAGSETIPGPGDSAFKVDLRTSAPHAETLLPATHKDKAQDVSRSSVFREERDLNKIHVGNARFVSPDGQSVIGGAEYGYAYDFGGRIPLLQACKWDISGDTPPMALGILKPSGLFAPTLQQAETIAYTCNQDGSIIAGEARGKTNEYQMSRAFIWTEHSGMRYVHELLEQNGMELPKHYELNQVYSIARTRNILAGISQVRFLPKESRNGMYSCHQRAWIAVIPAVTAAPSWKDKLGTMLGAATAQFRTKQD